MVTMNRNEILKADLDDIVFAGRNQEYGAYVLRKKYSKHVVRAAIGATVVLLLLVFYPLIASSLQSLLKSNKDDELLMKEVTLAEPPPLDPNTPPPPPPPPPQAPPPTATIKFVPPIVKKDEEVLEEPEDVIPPDIPDTVAIATKTQEGEKYDGVAEVVEEPAPPVEAVEAPAEDVNKVYTFVEQQPEYPEGTAALMKWIASNLTYPAIARENGIEGTVYVGFVVEKTGAITDVTVKRGVVGGKVLDDEAVRVVKQMPKWKPGKQNGREVRVLFTLPVKFKLS
jgi:periplasmic protein TonB